MTYASATSLYSEEIVHQEKFGFSPHAGSKFAFPEPDEVQNAPNLSLWERAELVETTIIKVNVTLKGG